MIRMHVDVLIPISSISFTAIIFYSNPSKIENGSYPYTFQHQLPMGKKTWKFRGKLIISILKIEVAQK